MTTKYQISLDGNILEKFFNTVKENSYPIEQKKFTKEINRKNCELNVWNLVIACVERIRYTVRYLNELELGNAKYGFAFDFINFISNAAVLIDSVNMLAEAFDVDLSEENESYEIFNDRGSDDKGNDKQYFEYLRSISALHPTDTSRHKRYQPNNSPHAYSEFVSWKTGHLCLHMENHDLCIQISTNEIDEWANHRSVIIEEVFQYVTFRYSLLNKIATVVQKYQHDFVEKFKKEIVAEKDSSETWSDYISRLKNESEHRFGDDYLAELDFAGEVLRYDPTNKENLFAVERYKNAYKYALTFERNAMNNMNHEGKGNSGFEHNDGMTLLGELKYCHSDNQIFFDYHYEISKFHYLYHRDGTGDAAWGREKLRDVYPHLAPYVAIDFSETDMELYILTRIAFYEMTLETDSYINEAIPHTSLYRPQGNLEDIEDAHDLALLRKAILKDDGTIYTQEEIEEHLGLHENKNDNIAEVTAVKPFTSEEEAGTFIRDGLHAMLTEKEK